MKKLLALLLGTVLVLAMAGCGSDDKSPFEPDPVGSLQELALGYEALADGDYAAANSHFAASLAKDPSNTNARFGVAVTEVYLVTSDSEVQTVISYIGTSLPPLPVLADPTRTDGVAPTSRLPLLGAMPTGTYDTRATGRALFRMMTLSVEDPPLVSDIQRILKTKLMPRLQHAEDHFNVIEQASEFVLKLPPDVTGLPDTLEIDKSDVYLMDTMINVLQGWLGMLVAYDFDVPGNDFENTDPESLLAPGTDWATLHADGGLQLASARGSLLTVKTRLEAAAASLLAETDDQSDDLVPQSFASMPEFTQLQAGVAEVHAALSGPVDVEIEDHLGNPFAMQVDVGRFFVPAIQDLKTMLPGHSFDEVTGEPDITLPITFPDPTVNGIFPDMTNPRWRDLTGMTVDVMVAR